jgi:hypothetical protein
MKQTNNLLPQLLHCFLLKFGKVRVIPLIKLALAIRIAESERTDGKSSHWVSTGPRDKLDRRLLVHALAVAWCRIVKLSIKWQWRLVMLAR